MEILILGVVLVAVMVYVSTKIKKSAARAFEREIVETEDFRLIKPAGFISPIEENSEFLFEAYTKEFGRNDAESFRQAWANLTANSDSSFEDAIEDMRKIGAKILDETSPKNAPGTGKTCLLENERIEKTVAVKEFYKIVESLERRKTYQLRISVLAAYEENYSDGTSEMLQSFAVK